MIIAKKRVGIFAGSFDPIHDGHIETALSCVKYLELSKVFFMVEPKPWGVKSPVGAEHRRKMVELATKNLAELGQLKIDAEQFSIDSTLKVIERKFLKTELYFIFGADIFLHMNEESWPNLAELFKHYIVVIERNEIDERQITEHAIKLGVVTAILPSEHLKHSSTDVRLQPHKKSIWVPEVVSNYIDKNSLYKTT